MSHITLNYFAKGPANTLYAVLASLEFLANAQVADAIVSPAAQFIFWHLCNLVRNWYIRYSDDKYPRSQIDFGNDRNFKILLS